MASRVRIHFQSLTGSSGGTSDGPESLTTVRSARPQRSDLLGPRLQRSDLVGQEVPVPLYKYRWERELRDWGLQLPSSFSLLSHLERKEVTVPPLLYLSHGFELKFLRGIESPLWVWMRG